MAVGRVKVLGVDVGGSGVKAAVVETKSGQLLTPVERVAIHGQVSPAELCEAVASIVSRLKWKGRIGLGFPGLLRGGLIQQSMNLHPEFGGLDFLAALQAALGNRVGLLNDADAAGLAEAAYGAGKGSPGSVLVLTFGTGVGSALIFNQQLCPNTEFGQMPLRGKPAERFVSAAAKVRRKLGFPAWAREVSEYLRILEWMIQPDLIVAGGGISADHEKWFPYLQLRTAIVPASYRNDAGIAGAALFAAQSI